MIDLDHLADCISKGDDPHAILGVAVARARTEALEDALAALTAAAPPLNAELSMQGGDGPFTDPSMSAYVEGFHDAHRAIRALTQKGPSGA